MAKQKEYCVSARLNLLVDTTIKAQSLEDAVAQAKLLKETDFVTIDGEYMDGDMKITGLYEVGA